MGTHRYRPGWYALGVLHSTLLYTHTHTHSFPTHTMAYPSAAALSGYLFERIRRDLDFLHSQGLLDNNGHHAILSQLDSAAARSRSSGGSGSAHDNDAALALASQFSSAVVLSSNADRAPHPQQHQDGRERAKALWNYSGSQPDDLSFQKGETILIHTKENEHWWRGSVESDPTGRSGLFPSNHVELLSPGSAASVGYAPRPPAPHDAATYYQPSDPEKANHSYVGPPPPPPPQQGYYQPPPPPPQQYYGHPPPQHQHQQHVAVVPAPAPSPNTAAEQQKKNKFKLGGGGGGSGFGNTLAHAGVGGLGFGAGSASGSVGAVCVALRCTLSLSLLPSTVPSGSEHPP